VTFTCDRCGLCCRMLKGTPLEKWARPDGSCIHLTKDNLCEIYDHRPVICNVSKLYRKRFSNLMSRERWDELQTESCRRIKEIFKEGQRLP